MVKRGVGVHGPSPPPLSCPLPGNSHIVPILVFCLMNTIMNKEIFGGKQRVHQPSPGNASFSRNIQNNRHPMRRGPYYSSLSRTHPPIRAGAFRQNLPSPLACLPACPPARPSL